MTLFSIKNTTLKQISETPFPFKEEKLKRITENNLKQLFGLEFVSSEFHINKFYIDTLAFDPKSSSFAIIEYKIKKNSGIMDQGLAYKNSLDNHISDFILEYNDKRKKNLNKNDINKKQFRLILISYSFNEHQLSASSNPNSQIELWQIRLFQNKYIEYIQIINGIPQLTSKIKSNFTSKTTSINTKYNERHHLQKCNDDVKDTYQSLVSMINSNFPNARKNVSKMIISFSMKRSFLALYFMRDSIHVDFNINAHNINDPKKLVRDISKVGTYGGLSSRVTISKSSEINYIMSFIAKACKNSK